MVEYIDYTSPSIEYTFDVNKNPLPANIMAHTYCLDQNQWKQITESVKPNTYIDPYKTCNRGKKNISHQNSIQPYQQSHYIQQYPRTAYIHHYRQY